jgi:hypothetical protein
VVTGFVPPGPRYLRVRIKQRVLQPGDGRISWIWDGDAAAFEGEASRDSDTVHYILGQDTCSSLYMKFVHP